jgi:hypothetical protein
MSIKVKSLLGVAEWDGETWKSESAIFLRLLQNTTEFLRKRDTLRYYPSADDLAVDVAKEVHATVIQSTQGPETPPGRVY